MLKSPARRGRHARTAEEIALYETFCRSYDPTRDYRPETERLHHRLRNTKARLQRVRAMKPQRIRLDVFMRRLPAATIERSVAYHVPSN